MIPIAFINEWRANAPWVQNAWVEQDLIISRVLVELFQVAEIKEQLAFRGGTALNKLHFRPAARYSEDIDLVQNRAEPIGATFDLIRGRLDSWLGAPKRELKEGRSNLVYRYESEDAPPIRMRLKIETNSREHFSHLGIIRSPLSVQSSWFSGAADITTFAIDELLGTKLRALYQRKKGRDLFDLWLALEQGITNADSLVACFERYMSEAGHAVTRAQFEENLHGKSADQAFRGDIVPLLRPGLAWDFDVALSNVQEKIVARLSGPAWRRPTAKPGAK